MFRIKPHIGAKSAQLEKTQMYAHWFLWCLQFISWIWSSMESIRIRILRTPWNPMKPSLTKPSCHTTKPRHLKSMKPLCFNTYRLIRLQSETEASFDGYILIAVQLSAQLSSGFFRLWCNLHKQVMFLAVWLAVPGAWNQCLYTDCVHWSGPWMITRQLYSHSRCAVRV